MALLDMGADVLFVTIDAGQDFHCGLHHPRLHVQYVRPASALERYMARVRAVNSARSARQDRQAQQAGVAAGRRQGDVADDGGSRWCPGGRRLRMALLVLAVLAWRIRAAVAGVPGARPAYRRVRRARRWTRRHLILGRRAVRRRLLFSRRAVQRWARPHLRRWRRARLRNPALRRLCLPLTATATAWGIVRALAPTSTDQPRAARSRTERRVQLWTIRRDRAIRRWFVRLERRLRRWTINTRRTLRRNTIEMLKRRLRPWHRITKWMDFWRLSCQAAQAWAPDVVASADVPGLVGASIAARRLGVPHLHDCHELYLESTHLSRKERLILAPVERHFMRRANAITCVNQSIADIYATRYAVRPVVVRNCAPRPAFTAVQDVRELAGLPPQARVVLYQGGFAAGRGLDVVIASAVHLPPGAFIVLLGDGRYLATLEELIAGRGLHEVVRIVPAVPPDDLLAVTASADIGLVPYQPVSRNNMLSLPNKVFEYTGVGVPVVVSDVPELRRVVDSGGCGAVYQPYDPASLGATIREVLEPSAYSDFACAASAYGQENCWENEQQIVVAAYHGISTVLRKHARTAAARRTIQQAPARQSAGMMRVRRRAPGRAAAAVPARITVRRRPSVPSGQPELSSQASG